MRTRAFLLALASKYVYSPLVGLTRTVAPSGTTADYAYDSANRLISVMRNGTEIQTVSYRIGQDADNRVTVSDVIRSNSKHVRLSQFDGLGRLIKTTDSSTGVSFSRKYDAMGRLYGESAYGLLDDLTFSYPAGSSQLESVTSAAEGTDFYGRVGFPLAGSQYTWNDAGLMASDSGFGITAKFHTQNKKNYTAYSYSADGALLQKEVSTSTSSPFPFTSKSETTYSAGRIFYSATRSDPLGTYVSYFPGGYFDSSGGVHYMHLDYQGSVVMETDSTGHLEKHRGYYPYGEPWAEPTNKVTIDKVIQPQTYQSKERTAATGDYDFGPRRYISAAPFWRAPDPKAHDYPNISPYAFCAANPVRYADPTGMVFTEAAQKYADDLLEYARKAVLEAAKRKDLDTFNHFLETISEINEMAKSDVVFDAQEWDDDNKAKTTYHVGTGEQDSDAVLFTFPRYSSRGLVAHEFKHGYQFLHGEMCLSTNLWGDRGKPMFHDIYDEKDAYDRGALFEEEPKSIEEIKHNENYSNILFGHVSLDMYPETMKARIRKNMFQRAVLMDGTVYYKR